MRKVCVVVTARPSYSRIKSALHAIQAHPQLELQLVAAASSLLDRYGNAVRYMLNDGFDIAARVYMTMEGENLTTMAKSTGLGLVELATTLDRLKPDVVVTIADRYETIATSIAASYTNIPLAHVQGGEVTGSIDEKVRHANTKLANLHFVSTKQAADYVVRMGEEPSTVFVTGCPSIDIAATVARSPSLDFDPYHKYGGVGSYPSLEHGYIVVMQHPVTTEYQDARRHVTETLTAVAELGHPTLWFWPNVDAGSDGTSTGIRVFREHNSLPNLHFFKNMEPHDFLRLLCNSRGIVGNSSVGIRECSFLGVPTVNIGSRQANRERGNNVIDVSYSSSEIVQAIIHQLGNNDIESDPLYGDGNAGKRIANLLADVPLTHEKRLSYV